MKVLLVEDQEDCRRSLEKLIEMRGHQVVGVGSAEEAKEVLALQKFPMLILDWMLPGQSGLDLCRELRARPDGDEIFILLVTARSDTEDLRRALEAGANDYFIKPFGADLLNVRLSVAERHVNEIAQRNAVRLALKASARMGTSVLENTTEGFFALDSEWNLIYANPKAERFFERAREELIGKNFWTMFPVLFGSMFEKNCRRIATENLPLDFEATDAEGKNCFEIHAQPNKGDIFLFVRDVTERKRIEEERLKMSKLESLGTLAGGIAHDLNNILTVISGNIGLAQIEAPTEVSTVLPYLNKAGQAAQHAAGLSAQLLTFAKGGTPQKRVMSLADLLRKACEFSLRGSNVRAEMDISSELWKAEIDPTQIEQAINALVLNAREAMPRGGRLRFAARNLELDEKEESLLLAGRYVKVSLSDAGPGISNELASKIFDPYFTTKEFGSGLGLSIAYSIVRKHGGLLQLESSSRDGSTFAFYLPATTLRPIHFDKEQGGKHYHVDRQRILVMDDDLAVRELTSQLLTTLGYEVTTAPDGLEAVRVYEAAFRRGEGFKAVILDATVRGGMGGVATIERLRALDTQVTAIICSGYSDEAALSEFLAYGFRGALPKPFTRDELAEALQRALDKRGLSCLV